MKNLIKSNIAFLLFTIITALLNATAMLLVPVYINREINENSSFNQSQLLLIIGLMFGSFILQVTLITIRENYSARFNVAAFKTYLYKLFHLKYDETIKLQPTTIIERFGMTTNAVYMFITNSFVSLASGIIIVVFTLLFAFSINYQVGLLLFAALPLNIIGYKKINQSLFRKSQIMQTETADSYKELFGLWRHTDFIKQSPNPQKLVAKSETALRKMYNSMAVVNKFAQSSSAALRFINSFVQNISLLLVGLNVIYGGNGISSIIVLSIILPLYFSALNSIVSTNLEVSELNSNFAYLAELDSLAESSIEEYRLETIDKIQFKLQEIFTGENTIRTNINLVAYRGDVVRISGASGSGKSSLVRLLLKFRPCEGILINDIEIKQLSSTFVRSKIRYVSQDCAVFPFSIRENILLGADIESDWNVIVNSKILQPVLKDKTLDTLILENGANLSGGEKQRIALCRAVQGAFDVLILDEITSNLDKLSSQQIYDDVFSQYKDKIIFVITHDDTIVLPVTKQIFIEDGKSKPDG